MTAFLLISTGILLLIAVPIGMAMGTASLLTILQGGTLNALIITQKLLSGVSKFSLLAIPMFTLAGEVMTLGGVSDKLIYLANRVVGRFPWSPLWLACSSALSPVPLPLRPLPSAASW